MFLLRKTWYWVNLDVGQVVNLRAIGNRAWVGGLTTRRRLPTCPTFENAPISFRDIRLVDEQKFIAGE